MLDEVAQQLVIWLLRGRNRLLGEWAAGLMGLTAEEAEATALPLKVRLLATALVLLKMSVA